MKRGVFIMIGGISLIIINWVFYTVSHNLPASTKGILGYVTMMGWVIVLGGFLVLRSDKKKSLDTPSRKKKS